MLASGGGWCRRLLSPLPTQTVKATLLLLEYLAGSLTSLPTAWVTHCHITIINTHCWHLRNNLTKDIRRENALAPESLLLHAYFWAELVAKQSSVTHCLDELPALPHEQNAPLSFILSGSHFVPLALFFFSPSFLDRSEFSNYTHGQN